MRWLRCVALKTALATRPVEIVPAELYEAEQTVSAIPHTEIIGETPSGVQPIVLEIKPIGTTMGTE